MGEIACFLIGENGRVRTGLRRYSGHGRPSPCPAMPGDWGYHQAITLLGDAPVIWVGKSRRGRHWVSARGEDRDRLFGISGLAYPDRHDPRWPQRCACGYEFGPDADEWQEWFEVLYCRQDGTPGEFTLRDAPPGAMWDAWWASPGRTAPDGHTWAVKCPGGGDWIIDGHGSNCPQPGDPGHASCWQRTGEAPRLSVTPSIQTHNYHGHLTGGVFTP